MNRDSGHFIRSRAAHSQYSEGLRAYMVRVFLYMAMGLAITGTTAIGIASSPELLMKIHTSGLSYLFMFAPLGVVLFLSFGINRISASTAQVLFWTYAGLLGVSLSYIFLAYTGQSIGRIFFSTSAIFGVMAFYGFVTKKDLTAIGSFLIMGLWGVIIASLVNIFLKSSGLQFFMSVLCVLIFTGLTAYDVQKIKGIYYESDDAATYQKKAIIGALNLYIDFINIFVSLLHLFGERR